MAACSLSVLYDVNLLKGVLKIQLDRRMDAAPVTYTRDEVKLIKDKKIQVEKDELDALKDFE